MKILDDLALSKENFHRLVGSLQVSEEETSSPSNLIRKIIEKSDWMGNIAKSRSPRAFGSFPKLIFLGLFGPF